MDDIIKFVKAVKTLKSEAEFIVRGDAPSDENTFNKVEWVVGVLPNNTADTTTTNPHSEITWTKVKEEMDKL